jgi:hypothetical protein
MSDLIETKNRRNQELDHLLKLKKKRNQELEAILIDNDKIIESLALRNQYLKSIQLEYNLLKEDIKKLRLQIKSAKAVTFGFRNLQHLSAQQIQVKAENSIKERRYKEALQYLNYAYALTNSYKILLRILPLKFKNRILRILLLRFSSLFCGY